jgi:NADH-quinone oxidoreductase subunit H
MAMSLLYIIVFPGFLFLTLFAWLAEYVDRKLCARLQNRVGPPWFQPFADFVKLASKEDILPGQADRMIFKYAPVVALAATVTAFFYIPIWGHNALYSFEGDVIVVLYLLTIPTITFFLAGWYSRSVFSMLGAARSVMQLFAYEIPLFLSILAPALLANTWSLSDMSRFYASHPTLIAFNIIGLVLSIVALMGKLERVPFDIPEAETEIVGGAFTEYSGRLLAIFRLAIDIEMIVGASLIAAVFLPFGLDLAAGWGFLLYLVKVLLIVAVISLFRSLAARLRIDQMINFCWKVAAPLAFMQVIIDLLVKGVVAK